MPTSTQGKLMQQRLHNANTLQHTDLNRPPPALCGGWGLDPYDGILLFNTHTMFALHLSYPSMVFLSPLLKHHQPLKNFLAQWILQAQMMDLTQPTVDHATLSWFRSINGLVDEFWAECAYIGSIRYMPVLLLWAGHAACDPCAADPLAGFRDPVLAANMVDVHGISGLG